MKNHFLVYRARHLPISQIEDPSKVLFYFCFSFSFHSLALSVTQTKLEIQTLPFPRLRTPPKSFSFCSIWFNLIEFLSAGRHVQEHLAGGEGGSVGLLVPPHEVHHGLGGHGVDVSEGTPSHRGEAETENGSDVTWNEINKEHRFKRI